MGVSRIELGLSGPLVPRAFAEDAVRDTELNSAALTVGANTKQIWRVARVHMREALGQLFRCEVIATRYERFRNDPSVPPPDADTFFDRLSKRIDDDDDSSAQPDDLTSATDVLDPNKGVPSTPLFSDPFGIGAGAARGRDFFNDVTRIGNDWWNNDVVPNDPLGNWQQELLGIDDPAAWVPEIAPNPARFLAEGSNFRSVLIARCTPDDRPIARWITGLVTEFEDLGVMPGNLRAIRLVIEPQLAKLALRTEHRIFEENNAFQILETLFEEAGIYQQNFLPTGTPKRRRYCIQYGETDLAFALRLISEEGLVPVFEHHEGAERLRLVEPESLQMGNGPVGPGPKGEAQTLASSGEPQPILVLANAANASNQEVLWGFSVTRSIAPFAASARNTNFSLAATGSLPAHAVEGVAPKRRPRADDSLDVAFAPKLKDPGLHDFPSRSAFRFESESGVQTDDVDLEAEARLDLWAARSETLVARGQTNAIALSVGQRVPVEDGLMQDPLLYEDLVRPFGRPFLLTRYEGLAEAFPPGMKLGALPPRPMGFPATAKVSYLATLRAIPSESGDLPFVPERLRAPQVDGVQTVITRTTPGERTDKGKTGADSIGQTRGTLPWDHRGERRKGEQPLSPPIRVSGPWSGHAWGTTFLPREGMELLVTYLHGDPKQPIALGGLHSFPANPAPREHAHIDFVKSDNHLGEASVTGDERRLHYREDHAIRPSDERHINMIRTRIEPESDERRRAYHELSFDDKAGEERLRIHSEGRLEEEIMNDMRTFVGRDQTNIVQETQRETVGQNQTLVVDGNRTKTVTGHERQVVVGNQSTTVTGSKRSEVAVDQTRKIGKGDRPLSSMNQIGENEGDEVERELTSRRWRKTWVHGDDKRTVGGRVDAKIGGTFELSGTPLNTESTAPGAPGIRATGEDSTDAALTLDGAGGETEIRATGPIHIKARDVNLHGKTVRFETGEVFLELGEDAIRMNAPSGFRVDFTGVSGQVGGAMRGGISLDNRESGEIALSVDVDESGAGAQGQFRAVLRSGSRTTSPIDALQGAPGVAIDPVDTMVVAGGFGAFECRRVEVQGGGEGRDVFRQKTEDETSLSNEIRALLEERTELLAKLDKLHTKRDEARSAYRNAADERRAQEKKIRENEGLDDEVREAVEELAEAQRVRDEAARVKVQKEIALQQRRAQGQDTSDAEDELDDAQDDLDDAEETLQDEREDLEEVRGDHHEALDAYQSARADEASAAHDLKNAQDELVAANQRLHEVDIELAQKQQEAADLDLDQQQEAAE